MALKKTPLALLLALSFPAFSQAQISDAGGAAVAAISAEPVMQTVTVVGSAEAEGYNAAKSSSATKTDAPLRDIPQTVNVIPQALLRDQGVRSLQDALKAVPGVGMSHGDGQRDQVTIRGFSAIADQFIDGMRDDALYFRDLSNIEQLEVVKGPAAVLYGRGSSGGLINRVTKKPGVDISEVSLQVGSWAQKRGEFDLGRNLGEASAGTGVSFRVTGAVEDANSYRDQQFLERQALAPSVLFKLGAATTLLLQAEYLHDKRVTDFGIPSYQGRVVDVAPGTYYGAANARDNDFSEARVKAAGFVLEHAFSGTLKLRNALRYYDYTLDRNNTLVGSVNEAARTASLTRGNVYRAEDGYFNQTELVQKAELAGMAHQILYGVEFGKQDKEVLNRSQANVASVSLFNPVAPAVPFIAGGNPTANNLSRFDVSSGYVQDQVTLAANWKALAGVRYDRFEQKTIERRPNQPNLARTDSTWSPRAGLVYQPDAQQSYYASFSKSYQPSGETFALAANNADMAPEETQNKELGAKFDLLGGRASLTAAVFRLQRDHIKATDPATSKIIPMGTQRTDGVELTFAGDLGQGWQAWSGYSWLDATMIASIAKDDGQFVQGKRATLTPRHSMNLWLSKAFNSNWGAGAGLNYVGERFANPGNTVTLAGYTTVDAMAYYRAKALEVQLNVMNLLGRGYIVSGHGSSKFLSLPGAPRSAQLTVRYRF
jgi:catecholate siderophore receptor